MPEPGACPVCGNDDPALIDVGWTKLWFASGAPPKTMVTYRTCLVCHPPAVASCTGAPGRGTNDS